MGDPAARGFRAAGLGLALLMVAPAGAGMAESSPPEVLASGDRPLRQLAAQATAVALIDAARTESYDQDRLRVHRVRVVRVLRGRLDAPAPGVVEVRGGSTRPPLLTEGERVVMLLRPVAPLTYLAEHLPAGDYLEAVAGREGIVPVGSDAEVGAVEHALAEGAAVAPTDPAAARRLAFDELATGNPRLTADALTELRHLDRLGPLSPDEVDTLGRTLRTRRVDPGVRVGLIKLIAAQRATEAAPALATAEADTPAVVDALLAGRAEMGLLGRADLAPRLAAGDPALRAAAVRTLARLDDPAAVAEAGRYANSDPDRVVREAAIDGLGASRRPEAVPILARTFESPETGIKQKSVRAMLAIGGPAIDEALVDLALHGSSPETRRYAALALVLTHGRDHPTVRRVEASDPAPEVRELFEKGLERPD